MAENENKTPETVAAKEEKVAKAEKKPEKAKEKKPSVFARGAAWLRTTKAELKKIVWTPRKTVLKNTFVVLVAMIILGAVLGLLDALFQYGVVGLSQII